MSAPAALHIERAAAARFLAEQPDTDLADALLDALFPRGRPSPLMLVRLEGEDPALGLALARVLRLPDEGVEVTSFALPALEAARALVGELRSSAPAPSMAPTAADAALEAAVGRAETLAWRAVFLLAVRLGGPVADADFLERTPHDLLRAPEVWLEAIEPDDPDYRGLIGALARYRALVDRAAGEGGDVGLPDGVGRQRLHTGGPRAAIRSLRARLRQQGLEAPPATAADRWDAPLGAALAVYQETHMLPVSGRLDEATERDLGVPLEERLGAILAALEHIRQSPVRRHADRLEVNIPAFELRHFQGRRGVARHRVIVGSNAHARDPHRDRSGAINRTPVVVSRVSDVVLNPSWHVPRRIKELELDPIADRRPGFYDDFELYESASGVEQAVQLPGPRNALGRVKFVFPGGGGVFLHDTPRKKLFHRPERALSHGCVRVEDALTLARRLLEADRHDVDWGTAARILDGGREVMVTLNQPLPISIEYRTVTTAADGSVRFHADIYAWGASRLAAPHQQIVR